MSALRYIAGVAFAENSHNLTPLNQITSDASANWQWRATGADPSFEVRFRYALQRGWYMVEQEQSADVASVISKIYFDMGQGFCEKDCLSQQLRTGKTRKRLVFLEKKPLAVRYDPTTCATDFSIDTLRFGPVTTQFAISRMLKRVMACRSIPAIKNTIDLRRHINKKALREQLTFAEVLYQYYKQTYIFRDSTDPVSYRQWQEKYENTEEYQALSITQGMARFKHRPTVSIVMPVYNVAEEFLCKAIESVLQQSYAKWELCITDDASTEQHVQKVLQHYAQLDSRIRVHYAKRNGNISVASNQALALTTGEYVALLDHDDQLAEHALYFMIEAVNKNPQAQMFYSDEDKLDKRGQRSSPYFKPDWNQDLFYAYNYICHFTMIKSSVVEALGGFRVGVEGSQDYDLFLRVIKYLEFRNIAHIPRILYHWRMLSGSTASNASEKSYTVGAGVVALKDHFASLGKNKVIVEPGENPNSYRVRYPIPDKEPLVSLIIPTRDMLEALKPCVESIIEKTDYDNYELLIIDNQSSNKETLDWLASMQTNPRVSVLKYNHEFNYSAINNFAVNNARGSIVGLINNDIEIIEGQWLREMLCHAIRPEIGCVGAKLLYPDNTVQHAGVVLGIGGTPGISGVAGHVFKGFGAYELGYFSRAALPQNYSAVTAACLLVRKTVFQDVGGLDEKNLKVAFNDVDFCLKVREAGFRNLWTPYAMLYHYESKSRGYEDTAVKQKRFQSEVACMKLRWSEALLNDPAYNPNLTLSDEESGLKA